MLRTVERACGCPIIRGRVVVLGSTVRIARRISQKERVATPAKYMYTHFHIFHAIRGLNCVYVLNGAGKGKARKAGKAERGVEGGIAPRKLVPTVSFQWKNPGFRIEES